MPTLYVGLAYGPKLQADGFGGGRCWVIRCRSLAGTSWEIYGDWNDDPTKLETLVVYLLC